MKKNSKALLVIMFAVLFAVISAQPALSGSGTTGKTKAATEKATQAVKTAKVNINTADEGTLANLNGIGPALAKRIVDYRSKSGKFKTIQDLKNVNGIGDKVYEKIAPMITVK